MAKAYTPELDPEALSRLDAYAARSRDAFALDRPGRWCPVYLRGLITDGERKSIAPLSRRVPLPPELQVKDPEQALQQFVSQSPWDGRAVWRRYRAVMAEAFADPAGIFVIDDTTFPKQGKHPVGVQRQHCGALGKKADCQCAVSVHYVSPKGHGPLDLRLYLPESWPGGKERLDRAGVPEGERRSLTKGQIAPELLDRARSEGLPGAWCWPTPATASPGRSAPAWPSEACTTSSASPTRWSSSPSRHAGSSRRRPPGAARRGVTGWPRARPGRSASRTWRR